MLISITIKYYSCKMLAVLLLTILILPLQVLSESVKSNVTNNEIQAEVNTLKQATIVLSDHLQKWNNLFLTSLEPRMVATATSLANIDSNINNLQERAHVWDTFQLHVAAWNDQLAAIDRKTDIISKGQEKILELESKLNAVANIDGKLEEALKTIVSIEETVSNLKEQRLHKDHDILFGEFATRGILSSIKMIERKLDRLLISQQNSYHKDPGEKPRLTIKCNTPRFFEELLNDISSKVDIIFDKINGKEEIEENDFDGEDYVNDQSGGGDTSVESGTNKIAAKLDQPHQAIVKPLEQLVARTTRIEDISQAILSQQFRNLEKIDLLLGTCEANCSIEDQIIKHYIHTKDFGSLAPKFNNETSMIGDIDVKDEIGRSQPDKKECQDLDNHYRSGVYIFGNDTDFNSKNRIYNKKYCFFRNNAFWTVIQRRENKHFQNFNASWFDYKNGFGDLDADFWFGNDFISKISIENSLVLRIELEDFDGKWAWAEYDNFVVLPEDTNYKLIVSGYKGNASDSFSSHNGSVFSTFDKTNDDAPACCPCAVSYGGGWWFNRCFEANLNGPFYRKGEYNGYYGGIIWENWLGNYSLKTTLMMVKTSQNQGHETSTLWNYYEDP